MGGETRQEIRWLAGYPGLVRSWLCGSKKVDSMGGVDIGLQKLESLIWDIRKSGERVSQ